jgi:O-antigen ligase
LNAAQRHPFIERLWLLMAFTFPFFAVEFLRYYDEKFLRLSFSLPLVVLALILIAGVLTFLAGSPISRGPSLPGGRQVWILCCMVLFFVWHLVSLMRSEDFPWGLREVAKLFMGIGAFCIVFAFFPRDKAFIDRFWRIALWASAGLMAFLIYYYAFVFTCPFLGNHLDEPTRTGRNMLTWYLVFTIPYAVTLVMDSRRKVMNSVPVLVLTIAWIYAGSRGAWVSVAGGILALGIFLIKADPLKGIRLSLALFSAMALSITGAWLVLNNYLDLEDLDYGRRLLALYDPQAVPELHSTSVRLDLMKQAIDDFMEFPLIGLGLMNFTIRSERVSHNDYLAILADMGIIGFLLFSGILAMIFISAFQGLKKNDWLSLGTRGSLIAVAISFFFINAYTNTIFWIFLALVLVWLEAENLQQEGERMTFAQGIQAA